MAESVRALRTAFEHFVALVVPIEAEQYLADYERLANDGDFE